MAQLCVELESRAVGNEMTEWLAVEHGLANLAGGQLFTQEFPEHRVDVWVPNDCGAETPLLVMHDGRNIFFPEYSSQGITWGVLEAIRDQRVLAHKLPVVVAVWGIDPIDTTFGMPSRRLFELAPQSLLEADSTLWGELLDHFGGEPSPLITHEYFDLIVSDIIPSVARSFGLELNRERTAIAGSSMGGICSLYALTRHSDVFSYALSFSTHLAFWDPNIIDVLVDALPDPGSHYVWIDRGTELLDALYEEPHKRAIAALEGRGYRRDKNFQAHIFDGTDHSELAWSRRVEYPINWWLRSLAPLTSEII